MSEGEQISDHDLLIRIDERVNKLRTCMTNHLRHHWAITILMLTALFAAIGTAAAVVLR